MHGSLISQQDNAKEKQQWKAAAFIMAQQAFLNYQENRRNSQYVKLIVVAMVLEELTASEIFILALGQYRKVSHCSLVMISRQPDDMQQTSLGSEFGEHPATPRR